MFKREKDNNLPSTESIDAFQRAADQVTTSRQLFDDTYNACMLGEVHPWDATDLQQLQLVFAGLAFAHDKTAEHLRESGTVTGKDGVSRATPDIVTFATDLSKSAAERIIDAQLCTTRYNGVSLADPELRDAFDPEKQLPFWPYLSLDRAAQPWQGSEAHQATVPFMVGIVAAGRSIEAESRHYLERCNTFPTPVSNFYGTVSEVVRENYLNPAATLLNAAELQLLGNDALPLDVMETAYDQAHEGYLRARWALSVVAAPALLGDEFVRQ